MAAIDLSLKVLSEGVSMHLTWTRRLSSELRGQLLRTTFSVVVLFLLPALALAQSSGIAGTVWIKAVARCPV